MESETIRIKMIKHADKKTFLKAHIRYLKIVDFMLTNLPSPIGLPIIDYDHFYQNKPAILAVNFGSQTSLNIVMKTTLAGCAFTFEKKLGYRPNLGDDVYTRVAHGILE